jgi:hypothetical protein
MCSARGIQDLLNWTMKNWNWDLEPNKPGDITPIPEIPLAEFSYERLDKESKGFTIPVLIRGMFKGSAANQKWTHDYFADKYGENIYITLAEGRTDKQYRTSEDVLEVTGSGSGYQNIMKPVKMKLKNTLKYMSQGEKLYISNVDTIFRRNNELLDDLEFPTRVKPWAYDPYTPYAAQVFMGYGSKNLSDTTGTLMHCAGSANLFVQVQGNKD